ncbi:MAG: dTMP kinase [Rickettsiales bacterium]|mgnify:CR=1 FL=1|nr:dTMP kinase [Rickettsiales bacterium]
MLPPFITLEGGEGAGKSTQIKLLSDALNRANVAHLLTREPGGSEGGEELRDLVVKGEPGRWDPVSEAMLFMTARYHHMTHRINPAREQGQWVICDRFFDSTRVYQGISKAVGDQWLKQLYAHLLGNNKPDVTFVLDIDPQQGLARTQERSGDETRFESMDIAFHEAVREGFLRIAEHEPERCYVVDASQNPQQVHKSILDILNTRFNMQLTPSEL